MRVAQSSNWKISNKVPTRESDFESEDDISLSLLRNQYFTSRNGNKWKKNPYPTTRTRAYNIFMQLSVPKDAAKNEKTELQCFELHFDQSIIEILVKSTNIYIKQINSKFFRDRHAESTDV